MSIPANYCRTRRDVLKSAATGTVIAALPKWFVEGCPSSAFAQENSPNERPKVALIGCGGMGTADAKSAARFGDIVAVCDVDRSHVEKAREQFKGAKIYRDFREVCDLPDLDVVINGTPDHWHTLVNLRAVRSGKDVYSEKPLTLTIDEGKRLVAAVKETGRVLQTGSQQRSDKTFRLACELVRNGRLGKVQRVRTWLPMGLREGPFAAQPVPEELDWDFWQGQTRKVAYMPERCHVKFRYWWDYSGGTMTDWGAHHNDIALWGLGKERSGPVSVEGEPLVEPIPGGYTAASQYRVKYVYDDGVEHYLQQHVGQRLGRCRARRARARREIPRRAVRRTEWVDLRHPRRQDRSQRPRAHRYAATVGRRATLRQRRPHGQLLRVRKDPESPDLRRRNRSSFGVRLPPGRDCNPPWPEAPMGSSGGDLQERRRGNRHACPRNAEAIRLQHLKTMRRKPVGC